MGRPRPVREVMALLGSSPLICMPLSADNAGKNYGTGGDFTANSAPYVGARGASEFWARSILYTSSSNYLSLSSSGDTQTLSVAFAFQSPSTNNGTRAFAFFNGSTEVLYIRIESNVIGIYGSGIMATTATTHTYNTWHTVLISIDKSDSNKRFIYIDGVQASVTWSIYTTALLPMGNTVRVMSVNGTAQTNMSFNYLSKTYIDFSQEVNRLKFVDGLGYPLDLAKQIDAGIIPKPLIYLPFDDPTNLGKNLGTGGDFTVNGAVTAGADFSL